PGSGAAFSGSGWLLEAGPHAASAVLKITKEAWMRIASATTARAPSASEIGGPGSPLAPPRALLRAMGSHAIRRPRTSGSEPDMGLRRLGQSGLKNDLRAPREQRLDDALVAFGRALTERAQLGRSASSGS